MEHQCPLGVKELNISKRYLLCLHEKLAIALYANPELWNTIITYF